MLVKLNHFIHSWIGKSNPWTNVYGLARTIIALAMAISLAINDTNVFFRPTALSLDYPNCEGNISIFCMLPNDYLYLNLIKWLCVLLLLIVASGWRPRVTGFIHWWIAYSMQVSAVTIDGGEQVAAVFTLLLLPIALTDNRKWHWKKDNLDNKNLYAKSIALVSYLLIRVQISILYLHSTVAKLSEEEWINGTSVWYYIQEPMLGFPDFLTKIFQPLLTSSFIVIPSWGTLIIQFILFAALFISKKYWKYILIIALLMHEVFALMLGLISFSFL